MYKAIDNHNQLILTSIKKESLNRFKQRVLKEIDKTTFNVGWEIDIYKEEKLIETMEL